MLWLVVGKPVSFPPAHTPTHDGWMNPKDFLCLDSLSTESELGEKLTSAKSPFGWAVDAIWGEASCCYDLLRCRRDFHLPLILSQPMFRSPQRGGGGQRAGAVTGYRQEKCARQPGRAIPKRKGGGYRWKDVSELRLQVPGSCCTVPPDFTTKHKS